MAPDALPTEFAPAERATVPELQNDSQRLENEALVRQILDGFPEPAVILNRQRQIVVANDKLGELLNRSPAELVGLRPGEAFDCVHWTETAGGCGTTKFCRNCGAVRAILKATDDRVSGFETCRLVTSPDAGGATVHLRVFTTPIDACGREYTLFAIRDIGDKVQRELLEQANRELEAAKVEAEKLVHLKDAFVSSISHEIRSPLHVIIGMTEEVLMSELDADQQECMEAVKSSASSLQRIVDDVLDLSRIDAGEVRLEPTLFAIGELLDALEEEITPRAEGKGLKLEVRLDTRVPATLIGDPGRLRQVFEKLLDNSVKYTQAGRIGLAVTADILTQTSAELHFEISDTGAGIPPEKLESIFAPFIQADGALTRRHGGCGLGLAISGELVGLMKGNIWAESEGEGATFHVVLPFSLPQPEKG